MSSLKLWGTIVNTATVILGSSFGLLIKFLLSRVSGGFKEKGKAFGAALSDTLMKGLALCTLAIGAAGAIKTENHLILILSITIGGIIGTLLDLDKLLNLLGAKIEARTKGKDGSVSQGFVSASLLFCVGAMTIIGALNSGISSDHQMLYTKSILDLISSTVLAASLGFGVLLSAVFVFVFQGTITLLAGLLAPLLSAAVITEMTAAGSVLIIGLAFNLLGVSKIKIMNYLPAMFIPILLCMIM
ncbi:MAG: DUF554 domain-containing protein [Clostridia bacterium]|nr:DUF554 domain-containing protein [Clostridia bacterium]